MAADLERFGDGLSAASNSIPTRKIPKRDEYKSLGTLNPQQLIRGFGERFKKLSETMQAKDSSLSVMISLAEQSKTRASVGEGMYTLMRASMRN